MDDPAIRIESLSKTYAGGKRALDDVSFDVPRGADLRTARAQRRGQVDADQHPRGAGQQDRRQGDDLGLRHRPSIRATPRGRSASCRRRSSSIPSSRRARRWKSRPGCTACPRPGGTSMELLARCISTDKANAYSRTLSGGMKRRLLVAKAMVHSPPVLVLDEPTAGVDVELRQQLWDYVRQPARPGRDDGADDALSRGSRAAVRPDRDHQPRQGDRQRADAGAVSKAQEKAVVGDRRPRRRTGADQRTVSRRSR